MPMGEGGWVGQKHMSGNWQGKMPVRVDKDTSQAVCLFPRLGRTSMVIDFYISFSQAPLVHWPTRNWLLTHY